MYLSAIASFLMGYKPSCYENVSQLPDEIKDKLDQFPQHPDNEFTMFFQTEIQKRMFLNHTKGLDRTSPHYIKIFGDTLGYPPLATSFFADYQARRRVDVEGASKYFQNARVNVIYCGVHFMSHVNQVEENANWLWDQYQYEKPMRFKLLSSKTKPIQFIVPYMDHKQLRQAFHECVNTLQTSTYINRVTTA